ncbi:MAG TPA: hypothetical protein VKR56_00700 [Candidatus Cybelea sp.]|nr:hypothetical protein [Candidatus Cybelea sp.]
MTEQPNDDRMRPPTFFTLFMVLSMKWVMIVFPAAIIVIIVMPIFLPNTLSAAPQWVMPVIAGVAPFALGLISATWPWRRGTVSAVAGPRIGGPMWLFSAVLNRLLYLIVLPVLILVIVLLGRFVPGALAMISSQLIFTIGIGVVLLLLGLRLAEGIRRLR